MKAKTPLSFRLDDDVREKLRECAEKTGLPERTIAQMAITAAVAAAEKAGYRLVVPIEFDVKHVAVANPVPATIYPPIRNESSLAEESASSALPSATRVDAAAGAGAQAAVASLRHSRGAGEPIGRTSGQAKDAPRGKVRQPQLPVQAPSKPA